MARKLTSKQKKMLAKTGACHVMDLHHEIYTKIESLNNYETFYQDADRFLNDEYFKRMRDCQQSFINERSTINGEPNNLKK